MIALSFFLIDNSIVRVVLVLCLIIKSYVFIFKIKTFRPEDEAVD